MTPPNPGSPDAVRATCGTCRHWMPWMTDHGDCLAVARRETDAWQTCPLHTPTPPTQDDTQ